MKFIPSVAVCFIVAGCVVLAAIPALATPPLPAAKPLPLNKRVTKLPPPRATTLFRAKKSGAAMQPAALGFYTRGCLAGAMKLEDNGPNWQAMRLSRNRHWAHPMTIRLVKKLAAAAKAKDGWNGLLVGDLSMPRGGPMWPSHSSHQIGLDADIWLTPMPNRRFSRKERETTSATFMLTKDHLSVNRAVWSDAHVRLIKRATSFREVQRVLVHPAIKKELCRVAGKDRAWLSKVRPVRGHNYHFHIRLRCPPGFSTCRPQKNPEAGDGCGAELDRWYRWLHARLRPKPKKPAGQKPRPKRERRWITMADLPTQCKTVLSATASVAVPSPQLVVRP